MSLKKPKAPQPTAEQLALERSQREQLTTLDAQENERRKRLLAAQQGARAFRGSALFRSSQEASALRAGVPGGPGSGSAPTGTPGVDYGRMFQDIGTRAYLGPNGVMN